MLENEVGFEERVKDNRNYYTHHSSDKENFTPASLSELFVLSEKLKIILIIAVMKELGFSDEELEAIVFNKGVFLFNHVIKPRILSSNSIKVLPDIQPQQ